jgi:hypothetical protein
VSLMVVAASWPMSRLWSLTSPQSTAPSSHFTQALRHAIRLLGPIVLLVDYGDGHPLHYQIFVTQYGLGEPISRHCLPPMKVGSDPNVALHKQR